VDQATRIPTVGVEQAPGRTMARLPHPEPSLLAAVASDPTGASPSPRWGERARVRVVTRSFPPVGRRRPLLEPGGSGRLPTPKGRRAREHRGEALLQQRYSGQPGRIVGHRSLRSQCHAEPDERDPGRHPPGQARGAQRAVPTAPVQTAADSAVVVVIPQRVLAQTQGLPHMGAEGCESTQTPQPPAVVAERPP